MLALLLLVPSVTAFAPPHPRSQQHEAVFPRHPQPRRRRRPFVVSLLSSNVDSKSSTQDPQSSSSSKKEAAGQEFNWYQQWYPVAPISLLEQQQLDDKSNSSIIPQACTILGKKMVVWPTGKKSKNGQEQWSALDDTCPHRKTSLSTGKVVKTKCGTAAAGQDGGTNHIACRYHGWEFAADGTCAKIPMMVAKNDNSSNLTASDQRALAVTPSYPTRVAGGMLWVFLDPTCENLPEIPPESLLPGTNKDKLWLHILRVNPIR